MSTKTALITGVTGQDGAYLARFLLSKGYRVVGAYRRSSALNNWRLRELDIDTQIEYISMDLLEYESVVQAIKSVRPNEIYNLAAQTFVHESFRSPVYTNEVNSLGTLRILEVIRHRCPDVKFYQASTSEMYGRVQETPQSEITPFYPRSPYGVSKLAAHWTTVNYRESYNLFACCGILFNHESPLRGSEFVTRKITQGLAGIRKSGAGPVRLGNLNAKRDWGFAGDYVEGMWAMLQQDQPSDYVLATGRTYKVRDFINYAAEAADMLLEWDGSGLDEVARWHGDKVIEIAPEFYRPAEVDLLLGDPRKAFVQLGWEAKMSLPNLAECMMEHDLAW